MGLLNNKLCSWACMCRKIAGCSSPQPSPQPARKEPLAAAAAANTFPKFPSRQRNCALRRRRKNPDEKTSLGLAHLNCPGCERQRQLELAD